MGKLTKGKFEALRWFSAQSAKGRVKWFSHTAPSHRMRSILEKEGLIDAEMPAGGVGMMVTYAITDLGRAALKERSNEA